MDANIENAALRAGAEDASEKIDKLADAERLFCMLADEEGSVEISAFAAQRLSAKFPGAFNAQERLSSSLRALGQPEEQWINWALGKAAADDSIEQARLASMAKQSARAASRFASGPSKPRLLREALALGWGPLMFWTSEAPLVEASCEIAAKLALNGSDEAFKTLDSMLDLGFPIFNAVRGDNYFPLSAVFKEGAEARCEALMRQLAKDVVAEDERLSTLAIAAHPLTPVVRKLVLKDPQLWAKARISRSSIKASVSISKASLSMSCVSVASALLAAGDEEAFIAMATASPDETLKSCQSDAEKWFAKRTLLGNIVDLGGDPEKVLAIFLRLGEGWMAHSLDRVSPLHEMADLGEAGLTAAKRLISLGSDPRATSASGSSSIARAIKTLSLNDLRFVYGATPDDILNARENRLGVLSGALSLALNLVRKRQYATSGSQGGLAEDSLSRELDEAERQDHRLLDILEFASRARNGIPEAFLWEMLDEAGQSGLPLCFGAIAKSLAARGHQLRAKNFDWIEKDGPFGQAHEKGIALCLEIGCKAGVDFDEPFLIEMRGEGTACTTLFERALLAFSDMDVLYGEAISALISRARSLIDLGAGGTGSAGAWSHFVESAEWSAMDSEGKEIALGLMAEAEAAALAKSLNVSSAELGPASKKRLSL